MSRPTYHGPYGPDSVRKKSYPSERADTSPRLPFPPDDPPVPAPWNGGESDDPTTWEEGPALPPDAVYHPPGSPVGFRADVEIDDGDQVAPLHPGAAMRAAAAERIARRKGADRE